MDRVHAHLAGLLCFFSLVAFPPTSYWLVAPWEPTAEMWPGRLDETSVNVRP